jgi:hypothetical protein
MVAKGRHGQAVNAVPRVLAMNEQHEIFSKERFDEEFGIVNW